MGEAKAKRLKHTHCYLCGKLLAELTSVDHAAAAVLPEGPQAQV
jgi:hypothetical protein